MRILEIREATVGIHSNIRNAYVDFSQMTVSAVCVISDVVRDGRRLVGYGFTSNGRYAAGGILRERMIPRLLAADPAAVLDDAGSNLDADRMWRIMMTGEKPGGHGERSTAVGGLDMAIWDLIAKIDGEPLFRTLARRSGREPDESVFVYAAGGYYESGKGRDALQDEMRRYLDLGYEMVKIKIGGATLTEDLARIEAVLAVVGSGDRLAVDANGRFQLHEALAYAAALEPYRLHWYEEPGDPLDYHLHRTVTESYGGPIATGENLFSLPDARNLLRYGGVRAGIDILQFDPALSYGLVEYQRILATLAKSGWSARSCIPHGGHQMSLHIAAGLGLGGNESYPGVFAPFGGFADGVPVEGGRLRLPGIPGIGIEQKADLYRVFQDLTR